MNISSDILEQIICKMDNESIRSLSLVPDIWRELLPFINKSHFWHLRTQVLVEHDLSWEEGDWKEAYYILSQMKNREYDVLYSPVEARNICCRSLYREPSTCSLGEELIAQSYRTRGEGYILYTKEDNPLIISVLLSLGLDPSLNNGIAIVASCDQGKLNSVRRLLKDERVDSSVNDNYSLIQACMHGHKEIVSLLLQDSRVDPYTRDSEALLEACSRGHLEIVTLLLQDDASRGYKITTSNLHAAVMTAYESGDINLVEILLRDGRISPHTRECAANLKLLRR